MFWGRYLILAVLKKVKNQLRRRGKSLEMHFQKEILNELVQTQFVNHNRKQNQDLPQEFLVNHISESFVEMV